jgi:hypothetical protein
MNPMTTDAWFRMNSPAVTHEIIEGEAVIINLVTGNYYSLDKAGAQVWKLVEKGSSVAEITEQIGYLYDGNRSLIEQSVRQLLTQMLQEDLIVPHEFKGQDGTEVEENTIEGDPAKQKLSFELPVLQKFTDMQELLLLDPVHEVDETGWPHKKPDSSSE